MRKLNMWDGPGRGYDHIDNADPLTTAKDVPRWGLSPLRMTHKGPSHIGIKSANNVGDHRAQWGESWGVNATKSFAISDQHGKF